MNGLVERCVGAPAVFEELKHRPGRRLTLRASGPRGTAIVKLYRSNHVQQVVERISALSDGPLEPVLPKVLAADRVARVLVLSDVPGAPLREAVLQSDDARCRRAGAAIAHWHVAWARTRPAVLFEHTVEDELAILLHRAAHAPREIGASVAGTLPDVRDAWEPATVVHRDLSEEKVLLGERVGLIDLENAALGPPELDVGNLFAHLDLLALRTRRDLNASREAFLEGYLTVGALDPDLLVRCSMLARLRLACIHGDGRLARPVEVTTLARA